MLVSVLIKESKMCSFFLKSITCISYHSSKSFELEGGGTEERESKENGVILYL